jgi:hypothetical protein
MPSQARSPLGKPTTNDWTFLGPQDLMLNFDSTFQMVRRPKARKSLVSRIVGAFGTGVNRWLNSLEQNKGHSWRFFNRFRTLRAQKIVKKINYSNPLIQIEISLNFEVRFCTWSPTLAIFARLYRELLMRTLKGFVNPNAYP